MQFNGKRASIAVNNPKTPAPNTAIQRPKRFFRLELFLTIVRSFPDTNPTKIPQAISIEMKTQLYG